ncbi:MAG: hypothetical protein GPOALKHO_001673 [Sodalis sp.]|nr:MAG: hypothetical protein GPOALKHO_001673 [Sodalis sp.]
MSMLGMGVATIGGVGIVILAIILDRLPEERATAAYCAETSHKQHKQNRNSPSLYSYLCARAHRRIYPVCLRYRAAR